MVTKSKGTRRGTRRKLRREPRRKFKVAPYLQEFRKNQRVVIRIDPSSQKGMPDPVFEGKTGMIAEKRGRSYVLEVITGKKIKRIISRPEHLIPKPQ